MSLNLLKSILDAQDVKSTSASSIGIEFYKKFTYFGLVKKYIERILAENKKLVIINFDMLFYKFISNHQLNINNFTNESLKSDMVLDKNVNIFHFLFLSNLSSEKENYLKLFEILKNTLSNSSSVVIGLDLLKTESVHNFFLINRNFLYKFNNNIFFFSTDSSSNNLNPSTENKKEIIKKNLNYYVYEKAFKIVNNKNLIYTEIYNLNKLNKDIAIFEFVLNRNKNVLPVDLYEFDKLNVYLKEYKDLFESKEVVEEVQPVSTFKLSLNEKELQAKNEIILPYLKTGKEKEENRIVIDQEDLNELYEEDPDGDLDI